MYFVNSVCCVHCPLAFYMYNITLYNAMQLKAYNILLDDTDITVITSTAFVVVSTPGAYKISQNDDIQIQVSIIFHCRDVLV